MNDGHHYQKKINEGYHYFRKTKLFKVGMITMWRHLLTKEIVLSKLVPDQQSNVWVALDEYPQYKNRS